MQLSQINQNYINNINTKAPQTQSTASISTQNTTNPLERTPSGDTFELSTNKKKQTNKKTLLGLGLAAIGITAGIFAAVKIGNQNKVKKLITQEYDKLTQEMQETMQKKGFTYEKPRLLFKKLEKETGAGYLVANNTITINSRNLNPKKFYKMQDGIGTTTLEGTNTKQFTYFLNNPTKETIEKMNLTKGSLAEYMLNMKTTMAHELEHSKQAQIALNAQGGKELMLKQLKELPSLKNYSDDEIKDCYSFITNFKNSENVDLKLDNKIIMTNMPLNIKGNPENIDLSRFVKKDDTYYFAYTPKDIIDSMARDTRHENYKDYITNLIETEARRAEYTSLLDKNFEGVDKETLEIMKKVKKLNYQNLLNLITKN